MIGFIVNPVSAGGRGRKIWFRIEPLLRAKGIEYVVSFTRGPRDATVLAREMKADGRIASIVVIGGDGTVHEAAQELAGSPIPLGFIPAGSGNDFARALRIPADYEKALQRILLRRTFKIDIARVNDRFFVNGAGIGFDGAVAKSTNESRAKRWLNRLKMGRFAYFVTALRLLFLFRPTDVVLTVDGRTYFYSAVWLVAVSNIPFYGGGMTICPGACYDDGLLDLCIVTNMNRFQFFRSLAKVFHGSHIDQPGVIMMRGEKIALSAKDALPVHTDGECRELTPVAIEVHKGALRVL
ncbi:diacylglycerol kinase family lipid kinase [Bacillaceae bacterium]